MSRPFCPLDMTDRFPVAIERDIRADAEAQARKEGLKLTEAHWQVVCALQEF